MVLLSLPSLGTALAAVPAPSYGPAPSGLRDIEPDPASPQPPRDSDGDNIPDAVEERTDTSPFDADSDDDGVPDGVEDSNRDGVVDPGETDPRRPGLFPGSEPHIPEPLFFDLVRGLGARKDELEVNVLLGLTRTSDRRFALDWAPEVEWAPVDNLAVEFELPMADRHVVALKGAIQWTAPSPSPALAHGVQVLGEYLLDERLTEVSALYLIGGRTGRASVFGMIGPRLDLGSEVRPSLVASPSVFYDVDEALTVGLEGNARLGKQGDWRTQALAQVHWQVSHRFRLQAGTGVRIEPARAHPVAAVRLVLE